MSLGNKLFTLARSPIGDLIVGIAFGKLSSILPVKRLAETEYVLAFWHPKPFWDKHILIVPKKQIVGLQDIAEEDGVYVSDVFSVVKSIVDELGWDQEGYAIQVNGGKWQDVHQLHFHLYSGDRIETKECTEHSA